MISLRFFRGKLRRHNETGLPEVLIARRSRLPIPELLVFDLSGSEFGDAFETHRQMAEIGDGRVTVLKIEAFEKTLGVMGPHPIDRLSDGIG
jgi:hypothetical protein